MSYTPLTYQQTMMNMMQAGGFKPGELMLFAAGRQTVKSMYYSYAAQKNRSMTTPAKFSILDQAQVDGATWYTVSCSKEVSAWMRVQPEELQHSHIDIKWFMHTSKFDIHEKLYTLLALKWS
jgi:hypothetical protein